jgi:hypothetical protein
MKRGRNARSSNEGDRMVKRLVLWSPTGGLFAIAGALTLVAATMLAGLLVHGRYQFASSVMEGGQTVWRGDTMTGRADLCATELVTGQMQSSDVGKSIVTKC